MTIIIGTHLLTKVELEDFNVAIGKFLGSVFPLSKTRSYNELVQLLRQYSLLMTANHLTLQQSYEIIVSVCFRNKQ